MQKAFWVLSNVAGSDLERVNDLIASGLVIISITAMREASFDIKKEARGKNEPYYTNS